MAPSRSLLIPLLTLLPTISALPITHPAARGALSKRGKLSTHKSLGIGIGIAFFFIIVIIFLSHLSIRQARSRTWFPSRTWFHRPQPTPHHGEALHTRSPTVLSEKISIASTEQLKTRISCPMPMHSTALPEFSPVEPGSPPKFELMEKFASDRPTLHELDASPRRPLSARTVRKSASFGEKLERKSRCRSLSRSKTHRRLTSAISTRTFRKSTLERKSTFNRKSHFNFGHRRASLFDRGSWFCQSAMEVEDEMRRGRETSVDTLPAYPGPAVLRESSESTEGRGLRDAKECLEGKSTFGSEAEWGCEDEDGKRRRVPTMDWSGMEWLRGVYSERKSKLRSFYPRDEKTDGDA